MQSSEFRENKTTVNLLRLAEDVGKLMKINHPNVIKYHEFYEDSQGVYIVMEYVDGEELFDVILKRVEISGKFSEYETQVIV